MGNFDVETADKVIVETDESYIKIEDLQKN